MQTPAPLSQAFSPALLSQALCLGAMIAFGPSAFAEGSVVSLSKAADGQYSLTRNGKPYFINGAGGSSHLETIVACGGNSIRTWGIETLEQMVDGKKLIDRAQELGLTITAGLWIQPARHGFDFSNQKQLEAQREMVRQAVRKYRNHPAILLWGLGNEMEGNGQDARIWKEMNVLAEIVKSEDKNHPVMTVIAGAADEKIKGVLEYYPSIDILGVNAYSGASGAGASIKRLGWKKPFVLTEFGPQGHWEVPHTAWNAPIEPSSAAKAASCYSTSSLALEGAKDIYLGSYVFLWGQKQEATSTWYGMFLSTGEKLPSVDAMAKAWSGKWPANRSPKIASFTTPLKEASIGAGVVTTATVETKDAENDPLTYEWSVMAEATDRKDGGDAESVPASLPECTAGQTGAEAKITAPKKPGAYRLFVTVRDGKGGASKDNVPFQVR